MRLAELAEDLSPLSEYSEEPDAVPLDEEQNADSAIDEFMEDPASTRTTSLASTTSLAPHIEGDDNWDVLFAAEVASRNARRFCFVPPPPPTLTAVRERNTVEPPAISTVIEPSAPPVFVPSAPPVQVVFQPRTVQAVPHPPPCPPPAHLRIAQAHGGTNDASLGRKSKAPPSNRY